MWLYMIQIHKTIIHAASSFSSSFIIIIIPAWVATMPTNNSPLADSLEIFSLISL